MGFFKWLKEVFVGETEESCGTGVLSRSVKVRVEMDRNGPCWNFAIDADDNASKPYVKPANKIDLDRGPQANIEFRLQGQVGHQLDFDTSDPIAIQASGCPAIGAGLTTGFSIVSCTDNKLIINDQNLDPPRDYYYRLNFIDRSTTPPQPVSWDPIIRNGGGGP